jgi:hypothetical protein
MGRTLHYRICGPRELTGAEGYRIGNACRLMIERFAWGCETLGGFDFDVERYARYQEDHGTTRAIGMTKVAGDEWSAYLVVRFVLWASAVLPEHAIKMSDEGRYITAGMILVKRGRPELDHEGLLEAQARCERIDYPTAWIDAALAAGERGELFAALSASDYRNVPELAAIDASPEDLDGSLDALAERLLKPLGLWVPVHD